MGNIKNCNQNMKIGVLHLSDLHIQDESLIERIEKVVKSIEYDIKQISHLYIVFSGDITNSGKKTEFDIAKTFVSNLIEKLKKKSAILNIEQLAVPGNHDCCFDNVKKTRKSIINDCT